MDLYSHYKEQYAPISSIGKGAYAEVFICQNRIDKQSYAIKIIPTNREAVKRDCLECEVMSRIEHPNIARYHHAWIEEGIAHVSKEFLAELKVLDEEELSEEELSDEELGDEKPSDEPTRTLFISMKVYSCGALDESKIMELDGEKINRIYDGLLSALEYLQKNEIVHGDIKPPNILVDEDFNPILADFGSAFLVKGDFGVKKHVGTLGYLPPSKDGKDVEPSYASDMYAFGITMLQIMLALPALGSEFYKMKQALLDGKEVPKLMQTDERIRDAVFRILNAPSSPPSVAELTAGIMEGDEGI